MKDCIRISLLTFFVLSNLACFGEVHSISCLEEDSVSKQNEPTDIFQLFPTQNMWTFIKLNTRNGLMWQVQFSMSSEDRFEIPLNFSPLVTKQHEQNGRFTLYPTQNMYNFMLLDQLTGNVWQVQWSHKVKEQAVLPIRNLMND